MLWDHLVRKVPTKPNSLEYSLLVHPAPQNRTALVHWRYFSTSTHKIDIDGIFSVNFWHWRYFPKFTKKILSSSKMLSLKKTPAGDWFSMLYAEHSQNLADGIFFWLTAFFFKTLFFFGEKMLSIEAKLKVIPKIVSFRILSLTVFFFNGICKVFWKKQRKMLAMTVFAKCWDGKKLLSWLSRYCNHNRAWS